VLSRREVTEATTSLGVDIAPDGNMRAQFKTLLDKSQLWASQIATSKLAYVPPPNHILISHGMRVYNEACHQASLGGHGVL
jgi:hypothetical protein